jgi:hypothetical protein
VNIFCQFNPLFYSPLSFTSYPLLTSLHTIKSSTYTGAMYVNIVDYYSVFLSFLTQI